MLKHPDTHGAIDRGTPELPTWCKDQDQWGSAFITLLAFGMGALLLGSGLLIIGVYLWPF